MKKETNQKAKFTMGQHVTIGHGQRKGEMGEVVAISIKGVDVRFKTEDEYGEDTYFMLNYKVK